MGRDDNCTGEAGSVCAATDFVEVEVIASLMRVPFSSKSTSSSPDRVWLGLLSHGVAEEATMFRPISDGGRGVGGGNGPSLKRRLGPHSCPLRSHERHFSRTDQSRSAGRHLLMGKRSGLVLSKMLVTNLYLFASAIVAFFVCLFTSSLPAGRRRKT